MAGRCPRICTIESIQDHRGRLRVFEEDHTLSFTPVRCYILSDVPTEATRGGRALSCDEFAAPLIGSCVAVVRNGSRLDEYELDATHGLFVPKDTWFRLERFAPGTVVAMFASKTYADTVNSGPPD